MLHDEYMIFHRERQQKAQARLMEEEIEAHREARAERYRQKDRRDIVMLIVLASLLLGLIGCLVWIAR